MKSRTRVVLLVAALCFVLGSYGLAADNAYLYLVNGIPGRDVANNLNPGYPIDILIDGTCMDRGLSFDGSGGPFSFAAGTYSIQISESSTLSACSNAPVINTEVTLVDGASITAVATISGGQPTLLTFSDNLTSVTPGNARFVFAQAADAPALEATLTQVGVKSPQTFTVTVKPGAEQAITVPAGSYDWQVTAQGSTTVLASEEMSLPAQSATFTYAVGQAANNSIGLVNRTVRDVF